MDTFTLSRIQFAANISFHILFPTITIALCWFLVFFRLRHTAARGTPGATGLPLRPGYRLTRVSKEGHCVATLGGHASGGCDPDGSPDEINPCACPGSRG